MEECHMERTIVGTVVGVTNPREFYFAVAPGSVRVQDIVCVDMRLDRPANQTNAGTPEQSNTENQAGGERKSSQSPNTETPANANGAGGSQGASQGETVRVWAKVVDIERINPLFPEEAAQELSFQRMSAFDTVISLSREMITAKCVILGVEQRTHDSVKLRPLTYPLQPASSVYLADPQEVEQLLAGGVPEHRRLKLGHLRGRPEFPAYLDAHAIVARHLGVLAATGAGKTVTVRKILEELLLKTEYPVLIFDPRSDYVGLKDLPELQDRTTVFYPQLDLSREDVAEIIELVWDFSGEDISDAQEGLLTQIVELVKEEWTPQDGIRWDDKSRKWQKTEESGWKEDGCIYRMICGNSKKPYRLHLDSHHFFCLLEIVEVLRGLKNQSNKDNQSNEDSQSNKDNQSNNDCKSKVDASLQSFLPVARQLRKAASIYKDIRDVSREWLKRVPEAKPVPPPDKLQDLIGKGKIGIVSLEGYSEHATAIVAKLMRQLFEARLKNEIPKFLTVVEEAHNFVPSTSEASGTNPQAASSSILRQIATEGRKYGMGLILISQRPSRLDPTVLSQCNSFIILRIINPADQKYIRDVVESVGEGDVKLLPDLATGEALVTGECVQFPIVVQVEPARSKGLHEEEDFIKEFVPDPSSGNSSPSVQPSQSASGNDNSAVQARLPIE